jgi:hypothetical protein
MEGRARAAGAPMPPLIPVLELKLPPCVLELKTPCALPDPLTLACELSRCTDSLTGCGRCGDPGLLDPGVAEGVVADMLSGVNVPDCGFGPASAGDCAGVCTGVCVGVCAGVCAEVCARFCVELCADVCVDSCVKSMSSSNAMDDVEDWRESPSTEG